MKRGWLAVALLVMMVCLAWWQVSTLGALTGELTDLLAQAEERAEQGDWTGAAQMTRAASDKWDSKHFYLHVTLEHDVTDQIATSFAETLEFLECREAGEYSAANARLMEQLKLLEEMEKPLPENLL